MKTRTTLGAVAFATLTAAGAAHAESVLVNDYQQPLFELGSGSVGTLFDTAAPNWIERESLIDVHSDLQAAGINTEGVITFLLAETSEGLTFMALLDNNSHEDPLTDDRTGIDMLSTAPGTTNWYINDNEEISVTGSTTYTASGTFNWADNRGDAFIWTGLQTGDDVSFRFENLVGDSITTQGGEAPMFQWVTWNGSGYDVVRHGGFDENGQYAFTFSVVPLPAPVLLGMAGLAVVAAARRRKLATA